MADLETQVRNSADNLRRVYKMCESKPSGITLPGKCYEDWQAMTCLHANLTETIPLFEGRKKSLEIMMGLVSGDRKKGERERRSSQLSVHENTASSFTFDNLPMDFSLARHFAITGYICLSWALYDRLANVCGRLVSWKPIPDHE